MQIARRGCATMLLNVLKNKGSYDRFEIRNKRLTDANFLLKIDDKIAGGVKIPVFHSNTHSRNSSLSKGKNHSAVKLSVTTCD